MTPDRSKTRGRHQVRENTQHKVGKEWTVQEEQLV